MQEQNCFCTKDEVQCMKSYGYIELTDGVTNSLTPRYMVALEKTIAAQTVEKCHCFMLTKPISGIFF
jgi:hypothetical protein